MARPIVIHDLIDTLPFHKGLSWEKFQLFCTDVMYKKFNSIESREYLLKGSNQKGIDVYSIKKGEIKMSVAQCKLYEYLSPQQVWDAIDDFLKNTLVADTGEFILCTSADLSRQRDEEHTIAVSREKLRKYGIDLIVWDERGLSRELRTEASFEIINIVYHYFGEAIALSFYGEIWTKHIRKLTPVKKHNYIPPEDYIERNVFSYSKQAVDKTQFSLAYSFNRKKETLIELFEKISEPVSKKIVLLSTAGFGKSEEIKTLAAHFSLEDKIIYPVKFSLADFGGQSIATILSSYDVNWENIREENILLLFDGLDEIANSYYQIFLRQLNSFIEQKPKVQVALSSRYNFYDVNNPPLRGFEIFLLYPLNYIDIQNYIDKKLASKGEIFIQILKECGFDEYISNPYYLTRLVRFYNTTDIKFPKNKSELFDRILFEQLEKDQSKYNIAELKEKLFPFAKRIASCMTISGRSILTDEELKSIIPDQETRKLLNHFSIFNRNATSVGSWSFEHKNLQEYLCAAVFAKLPFFEIHKIIALEFDPNKLQPRFLNTISFLFEIINKNSPTFQELFSWINENTNELFVRFEKEQLSKETRHKIFYRILQHYKEKNITMRVSTNFSFEELAFFVEVESSIIDFIIKEFQTGIEIELGYDILSILSYCKRAYRFKEKLLELLFNILKNNTYPVFIQSKAINILIEVEFTQQNIFEKVLDSGIDLRNIEIRKACLYFLENTDYFEEYSQFIFNSIAVLDEARKNTNAYGHFASVKRLLLRFSSSRKVKDIFKFGLDDSEGFKRYKHTKEFHFELNEIETLLEKAIEIYKSDKSILPLVYKLFCDMKNITYEPQWFSPFMLFFQKTCGTKVIFHKFYKYGRNSGDIMSFADLESCDFLIEEYKKGKLTYENINILRNQASWVNQELFRNFHKKLVSLDQSKFTINDIDVDYKLLWAQQEDKNQLMLLDRTLFLQEAEIIFSIIDKDKIFTCDLRFSENAVLRKYQNSIVIETIRSGCIHDEDKMITRDTFLKNYEDDKKWEGFVIETATNMLDNKNKTLDPRLLLILSNWCRYKIETLNFENSLTDQQDGNTFNYNPLVEFVKSLFLKLNLDLEDKLLIKMLPSDFDSFYGWNDGSENTISSVVIKNVKDKVLLHDAVIANIKNGRLSILTLCSHFAICHKLGYRQCLQVLFSTIANHPFLKDYNRIKLTGYYLDLGGEKIDFVKFLKISEKTSEGAKYSAWHWFLIEDLLFIAPEKVTEILLQILNDPDKDQNKLKAARHLIQLSRIEGLEYIELFVQETKSLPYEHNWANLHQYIGCLPADKSIEIFFSILEFAYANGIQDKFNGEGQIQDALFGSLITIAAQGHKYYIIINERLNKIIIDSAGRPFEKSLKFSSERFSQLYYQSQNQEIDIQKADLIYQSIKL